MKTLLNGRSNKAFTALFHAAPPENRRHPTRKATGTTASLYYNVFGERLDIVAIGGTPDIFQQPMHMLDLTFQQRLLYGFSLKASAKNLLNEQYVFAHTYKGNDFVHQEYGLGRVYSVGVTYNVD